MSHYTYTDPDGDRIEFRELHTGEIVIAAAGIGDIAVLPVSERARAAQALVGRSGAIYERAVDVLSEPEFLPGHPEIAHIADILVGENRYTSTMTEAQLEAYSLCGDACVTVIECGDSCCDGSCAP